MKRPVQKVFVLAVAVVAITLIAGCSEQNLSDTKKSRFIAGENIQLKEELKQLAQEIERQRKLHNTEMEKQRVLLAKYLQEKKALQEQSGENIQDLMNNILKNVVEGHTKLHEENQVLKAQVQQLQAQVQQLKKELKELRKWWPDKPRPL